MKCAVTLAFALCLIHGLQARRIQNGRSVAARARAADKQIQRNEQPNSALLEEVEDGTSLDKDAKNEKLVNHRRPKKITAWNAIGWTAKKAPKALGWTAKKVVAPAAKFVGKKLELPPGRLFPRLRLLRNKL